MSLIKLGLENRDEHAAQLAGAEEDIRNGWGAGLVSAGITTVVVLITLGGDSDTPRTALNESSFWDVALLLGLAYGIYRKSRICAVLMVSFFVAGTIYKMLEYHSFGLIGAVIFGYFYVRAAIGTFRYHTLMEQAQQAPVEVGSQAGAIQLPPPAAATQPSPLKTLLWIVGTIFTLGAIAVVVLLLVFAAITPPADVVGGAQLDSEYIDAIRELNILEQRESIDFFYTDALIDFETGFYLLTDRRVIVYSSEFEEPLISIPFGDIAEMETEMSESWYDDSIVNLLLDDGTFVYFPLSRENGGDRKFIDALSKRWQMTIETETAVESTERL